MDTRDTAVSILIDALNRISRMTPEKANARTARDLHFTIKAIALTAIDDVRGPDGLLPQGGEDAEAH